MKDRPNNDLKRIADDFWRDLGRLKSFPRDIEKAATMKLPVGILKLPRLTGDSVADWLRSRRLIVTIPSEHRPLMGCLVAYRGHGIIFLCGADDRDEQRLTIGHEMAHLLHDYLLPRERAITLFGEGIAEVLDGFRPPTPAERVEAVLEAVPLGTHVHLLPRIATGWDDEPILVESECGADALALELLAPTTCRTALIARLMREGRSAANICSILGAHFGLPASVFRQFVQPRFSKPAVGFLEDALLTLRSSNR